MCRASIHTVLTPILQREGNDVCGSITGTQLSIITMYMYLVDCSVSLRRVGLWSVDSRDDGPRRTGLRNLRIGMK